MHAFLIFDLEGELFFGIAPELERTFAEIKYRLGQNDTKKLLLRLKRVRNPDVVMLEQLEHFLKEMQANGVEVWLAGLRSDLIAAMRRLDFDAWFPQDRQRAHGAEDYSATLAAIRDIRQQIDASPKEQVDDKLYYLV